MSDGVRDQFQVVVDTVAAEMRAIGFKAARGRSEMSRSAGPVTQRLTMLWREAPGAGAGYVEACPGFNFPNLESLAADLQGKKPRAGFITCSLNLGLLTPKGSAVEWRLGAGDNPAAVARFAIDAVRAFAVPFWDEFTSIDDLLTRYDAGDRRVCRGAEWPWRRVAACVLLGHTARATSLLDGMIATAPPSLRPTVEHALQRLSAPATR